MSSSEPAKQRSRDSLGNVIVVALGVSVVCSILVSTAATVLKPRQEANEERFRQTIVLDVANLYEPGADVSSLFEQIETRIVDLATGDYVDMDEPAAFDPVAASRDPTQSIAIPPSEDIAGIKRRSNLAPVYVVRTPAGAVEQVILPVYGKGLWSTLYGFLALEPDGNTVRGLQFYEHAETPGLGDGIDKPAWRAQWPGKQLTDAAGEPRIEVVRGMAAPDSPHQVDGLSGATLTGRGVMNLVRYWTGAEAFGPYLERIREEAEDNG